MIQKNRVNNSKVSMVIISVLFFIVIDNYLVSGCLITNCPRGGKRSGKFGLLESSAIKRCLSCGPGGLGQCFGPAICCGPFGCLLGTPETLQCEREGQFHESEPCIAGTINCRRNTGRCAMDGICCTQDSCHVDKQCLLENRKLTRDGLSTLEFINLLSYPNDVDK